MQIGLNPEIKLSVKQKILPINIIALDILSMTNEQLKELIYEENNENPFIEISYNKDVKISEYSNAKGVKKQNDYLYDIVDLPDNKSEKVSDYILSQLNPNIYSKSEFEHLKKTAELINNEGFIQVSEKELASYLKTEINKAKWCLKLLRSLSPAGICAENLQQCLMIQLERENTLTPLIKDLIINYLEEIALKRWTKLSTMLGTSKKKIVECSKIISELNPRPLNGFNNGKTQYIVPDVVLSQNQLCLNDNWIGQIFINSEYMSINLKNIDESSKEYFIEKRNRAQYLTNCIERRRSTLLNVSRFIVNYQMSFIEGGELKPLKLKDISSALKIHESTVSRAIKDKYLQTERGVFLLKDLFASGISIKLNQEDVEVSSFSIKKELKMIVENEDKNSTLSDDEISKLLADKGYNISRRTVAKYRTELGIPSSRDRKVK